MWAHPAADSGSLLIALTGYLSLDLGCPGCAWFGPSTPGKNQNLCLGAPPLGPGTSGGGCCPEDPCSLPQVSAEMLTFSQTDSVTEECGPELCRATWPVPKLCLSRMS